MGQKRLQIPYHQEQLQVVNINLLPRHPHKPIGHTVQRYSKEAPAIPLAPAQRQVCAILKTWDQIGTFLEGDVTEISVRHTGGPSGMNGGPSTVMFTLPYFFPFPNVVVIGAIARAEAYLTRSFGSFGRLSCRVGCQNQAFVTSTQHVTDNQFKYVVLSISCCN